MKRLENYVQSCMRLDWGLSLFLLNKIDCCHILSEILKLLKVHTGLGFLYEIPYNYLKTQVLWILQAMDYHILWLFQSFLWCLGVTFFLFRGDILMMGSLCIVTYRIFIALYKLAFWGPEVIQRKRAVSLSVMPITPPSDLTKRLLCSCAWSRATAENILWDSWRTKFPEINS